MTDADIVGAVLVGILLLGFVGQAALSFYVLWKLIKSEVPK